ncbi:hypothetical protein MPTK1_8g11060 [Marchantia polymorpha subsp. ruderalis]|uniref:Uncharacterized protein n=2 Tax=Marchantia polymorpha TaxID=3197 RepID=A0A176WFG6_MARPO|nr:hypothetical protein AXG93_947s1030 [Marchantia polymorpha subsp. ruderalis]PTQ47343.1 hypothetical protein MARPO_0008s0114 [Marchantia polymorpha]BBN19485.1 hypothetical protein Mp_8g11060 [Marchantia polymorpha subsp. ruderalis]|eukprot:PTQ47343.1 hypothetical protein MARPO_0008s0114 [Marchantia polymorpha]
MRCFLPCFVAAHRLVTCSREEKLCSCSHVVSTTNLPQPKQVPPMCSAATSNLSDSNKFPPSIAQPARRHGQQQTSGAKSPSNFSEEPSKKRMQWLAKLRLDDTLKGSSPARVVGLNSRQKTEKALESSRTPTPTESFSDVTPKSGSGGSNLLAVERINNFINRTFTDSGASGSTSVEKNQQDQKLKNAGMLIPVVCIIDKATGTPVVDHEQLFAIMKKKPGWMIMPHTFSGEGWITFQHWTKNRCDAKARLPYPNLQVASPEILDSFVQIVNQQHADRVFDLLSFREKNGGRLHATTSFEFDVKDKFCVSPLAVLTQPSTPGRRKTPKRAKRSICSEQSSVRSKHFR